MRPVAAVAVAVALAVAGCAFLDGTKKVSPRKPEPPTFSQYHLEGWEWERVDRVLVLPFLNENATPYPRVAEEARAAFTSELQRLGRFEVITEAPDSQGVLAAQIHRGGSFDEGAMLELARATHSDVVVHVTITQFSPYPRPRMGLVVQAVGPLEAKVVASVDGMWDTTDAGVASRCRTFYRQRPYPRPSFIARNRVVENDDGFAAELALDSPALFERWVGREVSLALLGLPVPGVISDGVPVGRTHHLLAPRLKSRAVAINGATSCTQQGCAPTVPNAPVENVK